MFKIYDGREKFFQWDLDRKLIIENDSIKEVHFCNRTDDCSLVCETYEQDGLLLVNVPNILLQDTWDINVYAYDGYTKYKQLFDVVARTKPADYAYTETEVKTWSKLDERITKIEEGGATNREIYVGEEEPTGEELIWIDPNGEDIAHYITQEELENKGYQTADEVTTLIAAALGEVENGSY